MKRSKKRRSISALLARYYLAFTVILALIFFGTYTAWELYAGALLRGPETDRLLQSTAFQEGRYAAVDAEGYLGATSGFAVYDDAGLCLYASSPDMPVMETAEELRCIPEADGSGAVGAISFETESGEKRLVITYDHYRDQELVKTAVAVLDGDGYVLEGGLLPDKNVYSKKEVGFLTGSWSDVYDLTRCETTSPDGETLTVVFQLPKYSDAYYQTVFARAGRLWLLAIPLYLLATLLFVTLLKRHFHRPLAKLNDAIIRLGAGEKVSAGACGGPAEIQNLGQSFDDMARKLEASEAETRRLEQQRIKMLTDISHDLKTPITVILGYTDAIRDGKIPPEELPGYLDAIGTKARALTELIGSFHEYSKTEHPDFRLDRVDRDLCEFLREYLADKYQEIELAGFSLEVEIPEDRTIPCCMDPFQLRRALDNILSNALRHNRLGTRIRVSLEEQAGRVILRIADNGAGIPEELRQDLFTPFAVGDRSRSKGGSGLGLAISRKILVAHGWSIRLAEVERGTAFEISIPQ